MTGSDELWTEAAFSSHIAEIFCASEQLQHHRERSFAPFCSSCGHIIWDGWVCYQRQVLWGIRVRRGLAHVCILGTLHICVESWRQPLVQEILFAPRMALWRNNLRQAGLRLNQIVMSLSGLSPVRYFSWDKVNYWMALTGSNHFINLTLTQHYLLASFNWLANRCMFCKSNRFAFRYL